MKLREYIRIKSEEAENNNLEKEGVKYLLVEKFFNDTYTLVTNLDKEINAKEYDEVINLYVRNKKPVQYILGYQYFYGRKYIVNENVLIPRTETELLCEKAIELIKEKDLNNIVDIGTGSGIIPITICKEFSSKTLNIDAVDISCEALEVAKQNASMYKVNINFFQSDVFTNCKNKYDLVISNPPYIPLSFAIDDYVKENEPKIALFAGSDGLDVYKNIINTIDKFLNWSIEKRYVLFEIGFNQGELIKNIILERYPNAIVKIYKDYNNLDRIVLIEIGDKNV